MALAGMPGSADASGPPFALAARSASVTVHGDRIVLSDLSPTAPRALLEVDVAPSPAPGRTTTVSRSAVRAALRRAGADEALADGLPAQQIVTRTAIDLSAEQLRQEVEATLASQLPVGVTVQDVMGLAPAVLPVGRVRVDVRLGRLRSSVQASVLVYVDDRLVERQSATVQLAGRPQTPTLRNDLPRGAVVSPADVELTSTSLDRLPTGVVTRPSDLVGKRLTQPASAGQPIHAYSVKVPPTIARGQSVRVVLQARGLRISRAAVAQEDGAVGETIRLKAADADQTLQGRIVSDQEVVVDWGVSR